MVITGVYQPSGVVAEAASEVKLAVYMPRNGIHHDKDGTYLYTEIESGDSISHYEKTDTSNVVISLILRFTSPSIRITFVDTTATSEEILA